MKLNLKVAGVKHVLSGTKQQIKAQAVALGVADPFQEVSAKSREDQIVAMFDSLPDEVRTPLLKDWVMINNLLDLGGVADALKYFDTLVIPQQLSAQAASIRAAIAALATPVVEE